MTSQNPAKFKDRFSNSNWLLVLGLIAITLYFNEKAYDPFNTPKLIILILVSSWLLGHVLVYFKGNLKNLNFKSKIYFLLPLFFLISHIFALVFTDIFIVGLIGDTQRRNGFLSYSALVIIFVYLLCCMNLNYSIRVIKSAFITGLFLSIYGLIQVNGKDFVNWNNPYNSMISTLGNPNFASSLLAIISLLILLSWFIKSIPIAYKLSSLVIVPLSIFLIVKSQSRQGLIVLMFGLLFYFVLTFYLKFTNRVLRTIAISTGLTTFLVSILGMLQIGPLSSLLYKDSLSVRGYYWRAAVDMFISNPLTGVGLDRYGAFFKEYREVGYSLKYGYEITSSNAHNVFLQFFSTGGIFLGVSYLSLVFFIFYIGFKSVKNSSGDLRAIQLAMLSAWIGFQAQSIISIDNIGISIWGWVLGGSILGTYRNSHTNSLSNKPIQARQYQAKLPNTIQTIFSMLITVPTIVLAILLHRVETQVFLTRAYAAPVNEAQKNITQFYADKVYENPIADPYYKFIVALFMIDSGNFNWAATRIVKLYESDPTNLNYLRWLVELEKSKSNIAGEIKYREEISSVDPWNAENYYFLAMLYRAQGDLIKSIDITNRVIDFAPDSEYAIKLRNETK
jgi:O-antigen ligase